jgi:hypothetical protein
MHNHTGEIGGDISTHTSGSDAHVAHSTLHLSGDCTAHPCWDGTSDGGNFIAFYNTTSTRWSAIRSQDTNTQSQTYTIKSKPSDDNFQNIPTLEADHTWDLEQTFTAGIDILSGTFSTTATEIAASEFDTLFLGDGSEDDANGLHNHATEIGAAGYGDAFVANPLSQFAATTTAQLLGVISDESGTGTDYLAADGTWKAAAGGGDAFVADPLSQFAATTTSQFMGVISDESGTGTDYLAADGTWKTIPATGGTPGGSDGQFQYNDSGGFDGAANHTYDKGLTDPEWNPVTEHVRIGDADEGILQLGTAYIGMANASLGGTDFSDVLVLYNPTDVEPTDIGMMFVGSGDVPRFVIAEEGPDLATYSPRSMIIGPATTAGTVDEDILCSTNFSNIDCNTGTTGADLGVQDDIEFGGDIYGSGAQLTDVGDALVADPLSQFAATTTSQLMGVISDESGTGTDYLAADGTWKTIPGGGGFTSFFIDGDDNDPREIVDGEEALFSGTEGIATNTGAGDEIIIGVTGTVDNATAVWASDITLSPTDKLTLQAISYGSADTSEGVIAWEPTDDYLMVGMLGYVDQFRPTGTFGSDGYFCRVDNADKEIDCDVRVDTLTDGSYCQGNNGADGGFDCDVATIPGADVADATTSVEGTVLMAATSDVDTGTSTTTAITPDALDGSSPDFEDVIVDGRFSAGGLGVLPDSDATPDVSAGSWWRTANTGTHITDFDGVTQDGTVIWIIADDSTTSFECQTAQLYCGSQDITTVQGDLYMFVYNATTTWWSMAQHEKPVFQRLSFAIETPSVTDDFKLAKAHGLSSISILLDDFNCTASGATTADLDVRLFICGAGGGGCSAANNLTLSITANDTNYARSTWNQDDDLASNQWLAFEVEAVTTAPEWLSCEVRYFQYDLE